MPKGVADGLLDLTNRGIASMRSLAIRGDLYAEAIDELVTEFQALATAITNLPGGAAAGIETIRGYHEPTITPESSANAPGQQPSLGAIGTAIVAEYTVNTDHAYRLFKIPSHYVTGAAFHIHWTKESGAAGDTDQSFNSVRWRISYTVFPGSGADINVAPTVLDLDDTYEDAGTTTRIIHRTQNVAATGFVPDYYVAMRVEAVTPDGSALTCEPALITADLTFNEYINQ